jgi:hypothetical protein
MCEIAGEFRWARRPDDRAVGGMLHHLCQRGPDVGGLVGHGALPLGHRRLPIIGPSLAGLQQMADQSGTPIYLGRWLERNRARSIARSDDDVLRIDASATFTHEHAHA